MQGNLFEQFNEFIQLNARRLPTTDNNFNMMLHGIHESLLLVAYKPYADRWQWQWVIVKKSTDDSVRNTSISDCTFPNH